MLDLAGVGCWIASIFGKTCEYGADEVTENPV